MFCVSPNDVPCNNETDRYFWILNMCCTEMAKRTHDAQYHVQHGCFWRRPCMVLPSSLISPMLYVSNIYIYRY